METVTDIIESWQDDERPDVLTGWRPSTLQDFDWGLRRLAECESEIEEVERAFEVAVAQLTARKAAITTKAQRGVAFFTAALTAGADIHRGELLKGKAKSRDLLHGRIGWRKKGERLEVTDKAALTEWLTAQPVESGLYRLKVEPEMKALQERFRTTGEIPPGTDVRPESEEIHIEAVAPERALGGKP